MRELEEVGREVEKEGERVREAGRGGAREGGRERVRGGRSVKGNTDKLEKEEDAVQARGE